MTGIMIGVILSLGLPQIWNLLGNSLYDRRAITALMRELLGEAKLKEAITDEALMVAYDYNSQQPRLYSKYFAEYYPAAYDVKMYQATAGSSAAPIYFTPFSYADEYGLQNRVIDGGIIANNPSLKALMVAKELRGKNKIRLLSLSVGHNAKKSQPFSEEEFTKFRYIKLLAEFMMEIEIYNTEHLVKSALENDRLAYVAAGQDPAIMNYFRLDGDNEGLALDKVEKENIEKLLKAGEKIWQTNKETLKKFIEQVLDERYGDG